VGVLNFLVKGALVALLALSLVSDAPQFAGKAMAARALTYPLAALLVPVVWWASGRRGPYPHGLDLLVVLPFTIDVAGNVANLYATRWFDDLAHFVNWAILATAAGLVVLRLGVGRLAAAALALGAGSVSHTLWELVEYALMRLGSSGLELTYRDTIGDLALSLVGSALGALVTGTLLWRGPNPRASGAFSSPEGGESVRPRP
jgi:hypothetical protein